MNIFCKLETKRSTKMCFFNSTVKKSTKSYNADNKTAISCHYSKSNYTTVHENKTQLSDVSCDQFTLLHERF